MTQIKAICSALLVFLGMTSAAYAVDRETFLKRIKDTPGMKAGLAEWGPAIQDATGEQVETLALFTLLGKLDALWNEEDKFQMDTSKQLVARMKSVNRNALTNWQSAFEKAAGEKLTKPNTLILVVQLDRIFDNATLKAEDSAALLKRLKSLPSHASEQWADLTNQDVLPAAVQLTTMDAMFDKDAFQKKSFNKRCDELKAERKLKAKRQSKAKRQTKAKRQ